jgi:hypothetical protein
MSRIPYSLFHTFQLQNLIPHIFAVSKVLKLSIQVTAQNVDSTFDLDAIIEGYLSCQFQPRLAPQTLRYTASMAMTS